MTRIGILAGGGRLPLMIAESVAARGDGVHIVGIEGEADPAISRFPHTWVNWGQIGRMVATLRLQGGQLVIAGAVTRPDLTKIRPDAGFFKSLPQIVGLMAGGDDSVLTRVVRFFEGKGLSVRGAHEVAPDLLAKSGRIGTVALSADDAADARLGFAVRAALGPFDAGQAVVVADGKVLAVEGAEGTDAMLRRVATLRGPDAARRRGVLAKGPKPGQELRIDMPAIGPRTIEQAIACGLGAVVVESAKVLMLDREEAVRLADAAGLAVQGLAGTASVPKTRPSQRLVGRVIGRQRPGPRDAVDTAMGFAAVDALAPFIDEPGLVVAREYILAVAAAEGIAAMLQRAGGLRQWGVRRRGRFGVIARRVGTPGVEAGEVKRLFADASAQRLAGIALSGPEPALAPYEHAGRIADELGLFLVLCEVPGER